MSDHAIPRGLRVTEVDPGANMFCSAFRLTIGDHDFGDLPLGPAGPVVERLDGVEPLVGALPLNLVWVPIYFEGDVDAPDGTVVVLDGATTVGTVPLDAGPRARPLGGDDGRKWGDRASGESGR